jgi:hypothetical protein
MAYASKYAAKAEQKEVPENYENVGRFWGVTGRRATLSADTFVTEPESHSPDVKPALNRIFRLINRMMLEGRAELIIRDEGTAVFHVEHVKDQQRMRVEVSRIACLTSRMHNLFVDADIDFGEGMQS